MGVLPFEGVEYRRVEPGYDRYLGRVGKTLDELGLYGVGGGPPARALLIRTGDLLGECLEYPGQILLNGSDEQKQGDVRLTNEAHATMIDLIHSVEMPGGETAKLRRV